MENLSELQAFHLDILKEIGNIGAGNAATALSQLLQKTIDMNVPNVHIVSFQELTEWIGGPEEVVAATFLRIEGDAPGSMFFLATLEEAKGMVAQLTGASRSSLEGEMDDLSMSALKELGNILAGSYLSALADFTKLKLYPSVPGLSIDMIGAILNYGLIPLSQIGDEAIVIDTQISEEGERRGAGHFFLLPDPESFDVMFSSLGVGLHE
ncbi:chemotaxis protein CheC [Halalkalibacterium halodurans]|jgi:chemotaxis protein CheC|uniref:Inhibition of CheR-mediated methylation of MCPs n=2 Tax=Halalkalibacterium halodurans TaxID=86665 RepID=Q9KA56_HALH5|nr:chemotaxis protein CheC [Halalkalibacterium halodurans]MDY7222982.1 chemotaxis protein CheC [Halalkalibacterium halodurans]MDY7242203.1 chemotaxis protein CheC [Halalkalibacterium halodurans]MED3646189.1 chemotaxis protein CheC [Halalkalibacterium halodurans]MED4081569.1 chemotaxis protein CheC [Halalkalibacterium halodurans]MED4086185.1 chemotaxis protein CheC [Halalkalibacterium halodurans]